METIETWLFDAMTQMIMGTENYEEQKPLIDAILNPDTYPLEAWCNDKLMDAVENLTLYDVLTGLVKHKQLKLKLIKWVGAWTKGHAETLAKTLKD